MHKRYICANYPVNGWFLFKDKNVHLELFVFCPLVITSNWTQQRPDFLHPILFLPSLSFHRFLPLYCGNKLKAYHCKASCFKWMVKLFTPSFEFHLLSSGGSKKEHIVVIDEGIH
ncbi:hypothetical protein ILYODFUR_010260 [Ilyodon furcidens]|uniref:Uncharacterized protein n=1 Tax=Ilyodon furcidens TaxID=33524 RepID=A0ABV0UJ22_9TELE